MSVEKKTCVTLIAVTLLGILPLGGSSLEFINSGASKYTNGGSLMMGKHAPNVLSLHEQDLVETRLHDSRFKRSVKGKLYGTFSEVGFCFIKD